MAKRTDSGSRLIRASADAIYAALTDAEAVARWRPPEGMTARVDLFEPRIGGRFRMAFHYTAAEYAESGKTAANEDAFAGVFVDLVPGQKVIERVTFQSDDPTFADPMIITTTLEAAGDGTLVTMRLDDVPDVIAPADHAEGIASSLANLAGYVEGR